jgi:hypothetical protein
LTQIWGWIAIASAIVVWLWPGMSSKAGAATFLVVDGVGLLCVATAMLVTWINDQRKADRDDDREVQSVEKWFSSRGHAIAISEEDGEFWLALVRTGEVVAPRYGRGRSRAEAADRARQRYLEEQ